MTVVQDEFGQLAQKFEEAAVYQYAAMCHLGMAKCQSYLNDSLGECHSTLRAARLYLKAHENSAALAFRAIDNEYREAAIHCFAQAIEKCPDDGVLKAAIIREMTPLQPYYQGTSTFDSSAHRIYEMVAGIDSCILEGSNLYMALQLVDAIVDNIYERKQSSLYMELLKSMEVLRIFLLMAISPPPACQTPAHAELLEHYLKVANFEIEEDDLQCKPGEDDTCWRPGQMLSFDVQCDVAEIVLAWHHCCNHDILLCCRAFLNVYPTSNQTLRCLLKYIIQSVFA